MNAVSKIHALCVSYSHLLTPYDLSFNVNNINNMLDVLFFFFKNKITDVFECNESLRYWKKLIELITKILNHHQISKIEKITYQEPSRFLILNPLSSFISRYFFVHLIFSNSLF